MPHRRKNTDYDDRYIEQRFKSIEKSIDDHEYEAEERYKEIKNMVETGLSTKVSNERFKPVQQTNYWILAALGTMLISLITYFLTK